MKKILLALSISLVSSYVLADQSSTTINASTQSPVYTLDDKLVLGRVESVYLNEIEALTGVSFAGKIDTGADTTSMHATNIRVSSSHSKFSHLKDQELMKALVDFAPIDNVDYDDWNAELFAPYGVEVTFTIKHPHTGENIQITRPIEHVGVIRNRTQKEPILRPTIALSMTIAGKTVMTEVNLTDRTQFSAPILIGKTFLDNNAWVYAGYDYLQEQQNAQLIGKKEAVEIAGVKQKVSYSLQNNYSALHATNIKVDNKKQQVSFDIEDDNGNRSTLTRPLVRMLNVSGTKRPMVFIPVETNDAETQYWFVYLTDRSKFNSQLRLGKGTLNRRFMIDTSAVSLLAGTPQTMSSKSKAMQVSGEESLLLDGIELTAEPSLVVKTSLLKVASFEIFDKNGKEWVTYYLTDQNGEAQQFSKPINKTLKVGDSTRPVVFGTFTLYGEKVELPYAIDVLDQDETKDYFIIGQKMSKNGVLINTRTDHLLDSYPLFKAGHIEVAQVEGLSFPVKLDTGADVSSINAQNIKQFEKDGKPMVSFTYKNDLGMEKDFTLEVVDSMKIRAKKGEQPTIRPVVEMQVKLGELEKKIRVNLKDRSRFHYSMILGKNFLKYGAVVGSEHNYILTDKPASEK
ncbi:putative ATP-dependent zinc protease [Vibrio bivalvicida]|uniref:Peptidase n=1 Tax=Vibrio bivalvicida TaxID=1276888 RepID=A0A177Y5F6_9VIBR|nr:RimK/LysX family protein [Vibrio bivalvicida]OAJ96094.1 peptidase [Vibrio bivalvicida]